MKFEASTDAPIFVATDLESGSDAAIVQGHARALAQGVPLIVCHVLASAEAIADANAALRERVRVLTGREPGDYVEILAEGTPADVIVEQATRRGAGLLVVGPGRAKLVVGDTTSLVIRRAHGPVLVARPDVGAGPVLACTDFSDGSFPALVSGSAEAQRTGSPLVAIHVVPVETLIEADPLGMSRAMSPLVTDELRASAEVRLAEVLAERRIDARVCAVGGEAGAQILQLASALPARLVVVGTHGRTGWRRFFVGSVAEQVAHSAPCSVLIERLAAPLAS